MLAKAGESDRAIKVKMVYFLLPSVSWTLLIMRRPASAQTFILRKTERRKDEQALISVYPLLRFSILLRSLRFLHVPPLLCSRNHDIIFVHRKGTWQTNYRQLLLTTYIH